MIRDFFMTFLMIFYIFMNLIFLPKKKESSFIHGVYAEGAEIFFLVPLRIIDDNDGISNMPFVCIKKVFFCRNLSALL